MRAVRTIAVCALLAAACAKNGPAGASAAADGAPMLARGVPQTAARAQALSGASWGAYEVGYFSLVLSSSTQVVRPYVFAAQNLLHGLMQVSGSLVGAWLLALFDRRFTWLFAATALARGAVAVVAPRIVPRAAGGEEPTRRALLLRVVGIRPHGGVVHRPVEASDEEVAPA